MKQQKSIKKNMFMSLLLTVSNFIFPLITYSYVARTITPLGTGKVAFVTSILTYFSYIASLGIPSYGLRECAKVRDDKEELSHLVQELLIINLISSIISYVLLFICVSSVPKLDSYRSLFIIMSSSIILTTIGVEWLYQAIEEYTYITVRSIIMKSIGVVLTFLLIQNTDDYLMYGFLSIFTLSANYILNFINVRKHISFHKIKKYNLKRHLKPIFVLFSVSVIITIYANFDISMLGFLNGEYEVGLYNAALKIKSMILSLSTAITASLVPRISYYLKKNKNSEINRILLNSLKTSLLLALPFAIYIFLYSEKLLLFMCGSEYIAAANTLRVLMLCILPLVLTNLFGNQILVTHGREKRFSQSVFVGLWINLILNFLLIPKYGSCGAAVGTLATECWNVFWMGLGSREYLKKLITDSEFYKFLLSGVFSISLSYVVYLCIGFLSTFFQLAITSIIFFCLYYLFLFLFKETLLSRQLKSILNRFGGICNAKKA